jgi:hypothetical protein
MVASLIEEGLQAIALRGKPMTKKYKPLAQHVHMSHAMHDVALHLLMSACTGLHAPCLCMLGQGAIPWSSRDNRKLQPVDAGQDRKGLRVATSGHEQGT